MVDRGLWMGQWALGYLDTTWNIIRAHALELLALDMQIIHGPLVFCRSIRAIGPWLQHSNEFRNRLVGINHNSFIYAATVVTILSAHCAFAQKQQISIRKRSNGINKLDIGSTEASPIFSHAKCFSHPIFIVNCFSFVFPIFFFFGATMSKQL